MFSNQSVANAPRIVAFGEILWDMLPTGPKLGGAPVNFLYHARVMGAEVQALTKIGDDQLGRDVVSRLAELNVPTDFVQISTTAPTGVVNVKLDADGSPTYTIVENVAWDEIEVDEQVADQTLRFLSGSSKSAFYFGSLALRSSCNRKSLERAVAKLPPEVMRVCDLNIRPPFYTNEIVISLLGMADVFKLNDTEAILLDSLLAGEIPSTLAPLADKSAMGLGDAIQKDPTGTEQILAQWAENWRKRFGLTTIILTCGAHGAYLFNRGRVSYAPSVQVKVADAVGAGDSFSAVCVVGLLSGIDDQKIVEAASKRAAYVCSQTGATPTISAEDADPFKDNR
ncbi:MAG: carbohydrate kinase [Thermoguttaceae bacterium]|nr:carbohydrate kinase [Thermoguttaceae bacterium]